MAIAFSAWGDILVRVLRTTFERLRRTTRAVPMEIRGRAMNGRLRLEMTPRTKRQLEPWVVRGTAYAGSLPKR
jgi:hypothetical protein